MLHDGHWPILANGLHGVKLMLASGQHLFMANGLYGHAMNDEFPSRHLDKVVVRLPDGVREMLKLQADHNKRSMNAEIVARLLESLEPWQPGDEPIVYTTTKHSFPAETYDLNELLGRLEKLTDKVSKAAGREKK